MPISAGAGLALGSLASGLLGGVSNVAGALLSYGQQKKLAKYNAGLNYEYAEKSARNTPIWNRAGLESAGFNPMLAVQNSTSGANSSWTSAQSANTPDIASGLANAFEIQKLSNETKLAETQSNLFTEQSKTEDSKRTNLQFQNAMLDVEKHLKQKDLDTYDRRFYTNLYEQMQRAENYRAMANVQGYNAESARIAANAQKLNAEVSNKWTPGKIGAGLAVGALGLLGPGKLKSLKNVTKITKRSRNGRNSISQIFNEY